LLHLVGSYVLLYPLCLYGSSYLTIRNNFFNYILKLFLCKSLFIFNRLLLALKIHGENPKFIVYFCLNMNRYFKIEIMCVTDLKVKAFCQIKALVDFSGP